MSAAPEELSYGHLRMNVPKFLANNIPIKLTKVAKIDIQGDEIPGTAIYSVSNAITGETIFKSTQVEELRRWIRDSSDAYDTSY